MTSEEFFEYIESRGKGNPELENKFLDLLRPVIGSSKHLAPDSVSIDEGQNKLNQFLGDNLNVFLN